ncbi:hypothetical protein BH11BAC1_BH11BAC1_23950 [soil metagenome]
MQIEKIFVHMLDGAECYIPIEAQTNNGEVYEILNDIEYFGNAELGSLFEFYPGDLVSVNSDNFPPGDFQYAGPLLAEGRFPNRKYFEFLYKATLNNMGTGKDAYDKYQEEIKQIKLEIKAGKNFYRNIITTVEYLERNNKRINGS